MKSEIFLEWTDYMCFLFYCCELSNEVCLSNEGEENSTTELFVVDASMTLEINDESDFDARQSVRMIFFSIHVDVFYSQVHVSEGKQILLTLTLILILLCNLHVQDLYPIRSFCVLILSLVNFCSCVFLRAFSNLGVPLVNE